MTGKPDPKFRLICRNSLLLLWLLSGVGGVGTAGAVSLLGGVIEDTTDTVEHVASGTGDSVAVTTEVVTNTQAEITAPVEDEVATVSISENATSTSVLNHDPQSSVNDTMDSDVDSRQDTAQAVSSATVVGAAQAALSQSLGTVNVLADTGPLWHVTDTRFNSLSQGDIVAIPGLGGLLAAEVIHASSTAGADQVDSAASLADLSLDMAGITTVSVEFVRSEAWSALGGNSGGSTDIEGLTVAGNTVNIEGVVNQVVPLLGGSILPTEIGQVIINEHESIPGGVRVNAIHVILYGIGEVIIASSTAALPQ